LHTELAISFKPLDADYLLRVLNLPADLRTRLQAFRERQVGLSTADLDDLRELVGDRLAEVGFDENDKLTPEGARLEELIDDLFTG
jgi:hypothetical protein